MLEITSRFLELYGFATDTVVGGRAAPGHGASSCSADLGARQRVTRGTQ